MEILTVTSFAKYSNRFLLRNNSSLKSINAIFCYEFLVISIFKQHYVALTFIRNIPTKFL